MVFENKVLKRIFGPEKVESGGWRKLHNEKLHNYSSSKIVNMNKDDDVDGACDTHWGNEK